MREQGFRVLVQAYEDLTWEAKRSKPGMATICTLRYLPYVGTHLWYRSIHAATYLS